MSTILDSKELLSFQEDCRALRSEMEKRLVGQGDAAEGLLLALFVGGHVLLEGPPGVGKSLLGTTLAEITGLNSLRIQFTPDLTPADILGTYVVVESPQGRRTFQFHQGPLFTNIVLAEHLNRGTPRTQSGLLEALESPQVSVFNEKFDLPQPFMVIAAQNPEESEGVYPLPEPELDRFLFKLLLPPLSVAAVESILQRTTDSQPPLLRAVVDGARLLHMRRVVPRVEMPAELRHWVAGLIAATHPQNPQAPETVRRLIRQGASPRAAQAVVLGAKARAAADGRGRLSSGDLLAVLRPALRHRLTLSFEAQSEGLSCDAILDEVLRLWPVPRGL